MSSPPEYTGQLLHQACLFSNESLLESLLEGPERENMDALDPAGRSVVYTSVSNKSVGCLKLLLKAGADPNIAAVKFDGMTPLHQAALDNRADIIDMLLRSGADPTLRNVSGKLPSSLATDSKCLGLLHIAVRDKEEGLIEVLRQELEDIANADLFKCVVYAGKLRNDRLKEVVNMRTKKDSVTFLFRACWLNRSDVVEWLIECGAKPEYDPSSNFTPLDAACRRNAYESVKVLLKHFPELIKVVTTETMGRIHPLHSIANYGSVELLRLVMEFSYPADLLKYWFTTDKRFCYKLAFDVNPCSLTSFTPLFIAAQSEDGLEMTSYLLNYRVTGYPLVSEFKKLSDTELSQVKLEDFIDWNLPAQQIQPVDPNFPSINTMGPLHCAIQSGFYKVAQLLVERGADVNQTCEFRGQEKCTPLLIAVYKEDKEMISMLLKSGVREENTALMTCVSQANYDLVKFILKHKAHHNNQHKLIQQFKEEADVTSLLAISINWRGLSELGGTIEDGWIYECCLFLNPVVDSRLALSTITSIDVSSCALTELPQIMFKLPSLHVLRASENRLVKLPTEWELPYVEEIYFDKNEFDTVPKELFLLLNLKKLSVAWNKICYIPYCVWKSPKLAEIDLSHNQLSQISTRPDDDVTDGYAPSPLFNQPVIPPKVFPLPEAPPTPSTGQEKAVVVDRWSKSVTVVDVLEKPNSSENTLIILDLSYNCLSVVPSGISCLAPNLKTLNLSNNNLTYMGPLSKYPISLTHLNLSNNKINSMSDLGDNQIRYSESSSCLNPTEKKDRRLSAAVDTSVPKRLSSVSSLASICSHKAYRLEYLETLNLSGNKIRSLLFTAEESSSKTDSENNTDVGELLFFPHLCSLDLSKNCIDDVPSMISYHAQLSQLHLRDNMIKGLPPQMGLLKLWILDLRGCPLEGPLADMVEKQSKVSDMLGFLKSILQDSKPYATMKLMIVGQKNIGKTTLLSELRKEAGNRNPFRHFNTRVSNDASESKKDVPSLTGLSTVGVDIGDLVFDKADISKLHGKVTFKTWDFGGQEEYYATHQYFLSKRSLYLVVWKLTDGESALENINQWLVNIQTRAPNSPVIIVGTHMDHIRKRKDGETQLQTLREMINSRFRSISDPKSAGLPNIVATVEIAVPKKGPSCNIKELAQKIYQAVWELKAPGSSTLLLLEQKVPAIYIRLEEVVVELALERREARKDPVLKAQEYRLLVADRMKPRSFRDNDELNQASQFLHDNGTLLHYQDATLNDLYFLDPQWLCDMLAHVITIREVNPYVKKGLMKIDDLRNLFAKSVIHHSRDVQTYIVSLMSKFEMALLCGKDDLLLPSLLPVEQDLIKIPLIQPSKDTRKYSNYRSVRYTSKSVRRGRPSWEKVVGGSVFYEDSEDSFVRSDSLSERNSYISSSAHRSLRRVYLLSYIPSGFWPRLISRIYSDETISLLTEYIFDIPDFSVSLQKKRAWQCWKTGLTLQYMDCDLLKVRQLHHRGTTNSVRLYDSIVRSATNEPLEISKMNVLEIEIPECTVDMHTLEEQASSDGPTVLQCSTRMDIQAKLLARVVDHIETLLEDWYPDLGNRGAKNTTGVYLVNRLIPCPLCIKDWFNWLTDRRLQIEESGNQANERISKAPSISCSFVEDLLIAMRRISQRSSKCSSHGELDLQRFAPDLVFADVCETFNSGQISLDRVLGKGAFGVVYAGVMLREGQKKRVEIAVKTVHPVKPAENTPTDLVFFYQQQQQKWTVDPEFEAFAAYSNIRQEINILSLLDHRHIIECYGVLLEPLSILISLAPQGSLLDILEAYARDGVKVPLDVTQKLIQQTSQALAYLHSKKIVYRDFKPDNVLVWSMPMPRSRNACETVDVKLADYGVSRAVTDSYVVRGNWGTPGYMAPEIIAFKGDEEYNEKVDCFSFGMFIYELITLKRPFHNVSSVSNINNYILAGKRPSISYEELSVPCHILDLLAMCWNQEACLRPTAQLISDIASLEELVRLQQVVKSDAALHVTSSCIISKKAQIDMSSSMIDLSFETKAGYEVIVAGGSKCRERRGEVERISYDHRGLYLSAQGVELPAECPLIVHCLAVGNGCWLADQSGSLHIYELAESGAFVWKASELVAHSSELGIVRDMRYVEQVGKVYVLLYKGVLIEFCTKTNKKCNQRKISGALSSSMVNAHDSLWIGQKGGVITVIPIYELDPKSRSVSIVEWMSSAGCHQMELNHFSPPEQHVDTAFLVSDTVERHSVWSYVYPGTIIYRWNAITRAEENHFDIKECALSGTAQSRARVSVFTEGECQITCLRYLHLQIIAGTTAGCVLVLNSVTMDPVSYIQPHSQLPFYVASILPFKSTFDSQVISRYLTIGKGYKDALQSLTKQGQMPDDKSLYLLSWYGKTSEFP